MLTLTLLTWRIWWAPNKASKWQMGFNLAFNGLKNVQARMKVWIWCDVYRDVIYEYNVSVNNTKLYFIYDKNSVLSGRHQNTRFVFNKFFFPIKSCIYEILWNNIVQPNRPQLTIWRMRIACWIPECTNTHSHYVILSAFPLQQWLKERASLLRYTYIACLVITEPECVYCAVRTVHICNMHVNVSFTG